MAHPYVSVVILTIGDAPRVVNCLKHQTFQDFEIIFAKEKGIVSAMNKALIRAKGEILVRVDDDVEMGPFWLERLILPFINPVVGGVTGPTFVPKERRNNRDSIGIWERPKSFLRWLSGCDTFKPAGIYKCGMVSYDSNYEERFLKQDTTLKVSGGFASDVWTIQMESFEPDHLEGTNWAMRTELIKKVGHFDTAFDGVAEWYDTDVEQKIKNLGYELRYEPKAYLWHLLDFTENYNDRFDWWGRIKNWLRYHKRHSKFHYKMVIFLLVWIGYFIGKRFKCR